MNKSEKRTNLLAKTSLEEVFLTKRKTSAKKLRSKEKLQKIVAIEATFLSKFDRFTVSVLEIVFIKD